MGGRGPLGRLGRLKERTMASVNKAIILGHLGADPELNYTSGGSAVCKFSVATNRVWDGQSGREERTDWHRVVSWGKLAERCKEWLVKGQQVYVEGRIETRSWEDRDGNKRWTTEIVAREVVFLGKPAGGSKPPVERDAAPDFGDYDIPF